MGLRDLNEDLLYNVSLRLQACKQTVLKNLDEIK
jgi:hypothetical protein